MGVATQWASVYPTNNTANADGAVCTNLLLKPSESTKLMMGKRIPINTERGNLSSMRALFRFFVSYLGLKDTNNYTDGAPMKKQMKDDWQLLQTRCAVFCELHGKIVK